MPKRTATVLSALVGVLLAEPSGHARADDYYVATDGDDGNIGTLAAPFASVERAQAAAQPGDTVFIRGGEYRFSGTVGTVGVAFSKSGAPGQPIRYFAYEDEVPVFDLFELTPQARVTGLDVRADWLHLRGLEVRGVQQRIVGDSWGVRIRGDNNVLERLDVHDCEAPGVFITSGASNLIVNCDSHHNYDPLEGGGNADGFGCHSTGGDNVLRGCRAHDNSDDGFDFINAPGTCTVEASWAFRNGFVPDTSSASGNGAGVKAGGFGSPPSIPGSGVPRHVIRQNLAFGNRVQGFYANHHPGGLDFLNNTAFDNGVSFDMLVEGGASTHALHNNLAVGPGAVIRNYSGGNDRSNSWTLSVTVDNADFEGMDVAEALAPRQADGSLPRVSFMRLVAGSDLIDSGEDVGLAFTGNAPDLGAFEWGEPTAVDPADAGPPDAATRDAGAVSAVPDAQVVPGSGGSVAMAAGSGGAAGVPQAGLAGGGTAASGGAQASAGASGTLPMEATGGPSAMPLQRMDAEEQGGCGCRLVPSGGANPDPLLACLGALFAYVRRRRRCGGRRRVPYGPTAR